MSILPESGGVDSIKEEEKMAFNTDEGITTPRKPHNSLKYPEMTHIISHTKGSKGEHLALAMAQTLKKAREIHAVLVVTESSRQCEIQKQIKNAEEEEIRLEKVIEQYKAIQKIHSDVIAQASNSINQGEALIEQRREKLTVLERELKTLQRTNEEYVDSIHYLIEGELIPLIREITEENISKAHIILKRDAKDPHLTGVITSMVGLLRNKLYIDHVIVNVIGCYHRKGIELFNSL